MSTRTWVGGVALAALAILSLAIAAGGDAASPAAGRGGDPGWIGGAYGDGLGIGRGAYIWLERGAMVAYAVVVACAGALPRRLLVGSIALLGAAFALAPPLLSLDAFSYLSYARLEALHGLNPYEHVPDAVPQDAAVAFLADNRDVVSVYGPLFTLLTLPLAHLGLGAAFYSLKALALASVLAGAWIASRLAASRGADSRTAAALVALNPLVLVHVIGGGHNDALMAALMIAGIAGIAFGLERSGGFGLVAAAGVKAAALLAVPFALLGAAGRRPRGRALGGTATGMALGALLVLALGAAWFGTGAFESLEVAGGNQKLDSAASLPVTLADWLVLDLDAVKAASLAAFGVTLAGLLAWVARGADWVRATGWALLAVLLASSYVTPWYVIWVLPVAAVSRDRALVAATVALSAFLLRTQVPGLGG